MAVVELCSLLIATVDFLINDFSSKPLGEYVGNNQTLLLEKNI